MEQEQLLNYDQRAAQIGLQQAAEVGPHAYQARLTGINRDKQSAQNELDNPTDAYWSGEYHTGVDGHGNAALVTPELGMIPGRVHRENSNAMSDSTVRNVAYTFDRIQEGILPHSSWRAAIEQVRQFRAVQQEAMTLQDNESLLGFVMNGLTTEDGIALMRMTRHGNTISYETRLVGGMSEGAAKDLLDRFSSKDAERVSLREGKNSPLYSVIRGNISVDLKNKKQIAAIVQDVLDTRHETKSQTVSLGTCRTVAVNEEKVFKKPIAIKPIAIKQQKQEYAIKQKHNNPFDDLPLAPPYIHTEKQPSQKQIWDVSVRPWIIFDTPSKKEVPVFSEPSEKKKQKINKPVIDQRIHEEKIPEEVTRDITMTEQSLVTQPTIVFQKEPDFVLREEKQQTQEKHVVQIQRVLPITTFIIMTDVQTVRTYEEKAIVISLAAIKPTYREQTIQEDIMVAEHIPINVEHQQAQQDVVMQSKTDSSFEVDQLIIQDISTMTATLEKQLARGELANAVTKLLWMELNDQNEFVPVEEVEISQDATHTRHNLLHFLRKVVQKYVGDDVIRQRVVQRITSDKWDNEIEEIAEYLTILKTQRLYNHLFAVVN